MTCGDFLSLDGYSSARVVAILSGRAIACVGTTQVSGSIAPALYQRIDRRAAHASTSELAYSSSMGRPTVRRVSRAATKLCWHVFRFGALSAIPGFDHPVVYRPQSNVTISLPTFSRYVELKISNEKLPPSSDNERVRAGVLTLSLYTERSVHGGSLIALITLKQLTHLECTVQFELY